MVMSVRKGTGGMPLKHGIPTLPIPEVAEEDKIPIGQANVAQVRKIQIEQLNNTLRSRWKRGGKKGVAPRIEFVGRPDNPWRDRYLLCRDCERRADLKDLPPRKDCNCSTLLELDMTAPFSRDNVMATSCHVVQLIREDVRVRKGADGKCKQVDGKTVPGSFRVQVCPVCRKTSLEEGRRFRMCMTCQGVSYCSDECYAKHRMQHRASCTIPELPYREEWGIRKQLRKMRDEIYPVIHKWAIREPARHRIAWLPPPKHLQKALQSGEVRRPILPGFSNTGRLLPMTPAPDLKVESNGKLAIVSQPRRVRLQRPQSKRSDPDPVQLLNLGMTREEFLAKEAQLVDTVAREDAEAELVLRQSEAIKLSTPMEVEVSEDERSLALTADAVDRLEAAAAEAPASPVDPNVRPPWEVLEEQEIKELGSRRAWVKKRVAPKGMPSEDEKKDGVVYKESRVRARAKRRGLKLSEEALQRLEEAAAIGGGEIEMQEYNDPRYKHSMF